MEFNMQPYTLPESLSFNFDEVKAEVAEKVKIYSTMVYTEDQVKEAKEDKAALNKFIKAIEDKRKEVKRTYMRPYEEFDKKCKEITALVQEPVGLIDKQIRAYDTKRMDEKHEAIVKLYAGMDFPGYATLERIFDPRWLNASVSMTTVKRDLETKCKGIHDSLQIINASENAFEALRLYTQSLDLAYSMSEAKRMADIQREKAEAEARAKAAAAVEAAMNAPEPEEIPGQVSFNTPQEFDTIAKETKPAGRWISFRCYLTREDEIALKQLFTERGIEYGKA